VLCLWVEDWRPVRQCESIFSERALEFRLVSDVFEFVGERERRLSSSSSGTTYCSGTMCLRFGEEETKRVPSPYAVQSSPSPGHEVVLSRHLMASYYSSMCNSQEVSHGAGVTTSSTSVETSTYTDGEGTDNNSGSAATTTTTTPFPAHLATSAEDGASFAWWMRSSYPEAKQSSDEEEMEQGSVDEMKESTSEDADQQKSLGGVQSKLCPRGHWRPAEDEKLRELVSQYGPQNWNLIA
jgi:hypothetical protein